MGYVVSAFVFPLTQSPHIPIFAPHEIVWSLRQDVKATGLALC
jgi:hypothetical protein